MQFSQDLQVHLMVVWAYASRAARRGPWEQMCRDRMRFKKRIGEVNKDINPVLQEAHRSYIFAHRFETCKPYEM